MDVFITLNIKRADLFIKYEHFNEFFGSRDYFSGIHLPDQPGKTQIRYQVELFRLARSVCKCYKNHKPHLLIW